MRVINCLMKITGKKKNPKRDYFSLGWFGDVLCKMWDSSWNVKNG